MTIVKILCENDENIEDVKQDLIKALSKDNKKGKFADDVAEELYSECDSWFNNCIFNMIVEIAKELNNDSK